MEGWSKIFAAVFPAVVLLGLLIVFLRRWCFRKGGDFAQTPARTESLQDGIKSLHLAYKNSSLKEDVHDVREQKRPNYYVLRNGVVAKPLFSWADHPWLISEAVEHGWARFAFSGSSSSPLPRSTTVIWDLCSVCDYRREGGAEFSWEVTSGASECMQKIRLSPGSKSENPGGVCFAKAALPLPGPPLGNASFPQEAYFEITTLSQGEDGNSGEGEKIKLISDASIKSQSDSLFHVNSSKSEKSNNAKKIDGVKDKAGLVSLGLTSSSSPPFKFPGSYQGSIGFNSNGSVLLDGIKLVSETKLCDWGMGERVIGCGFDPTQKKVIFTVDSQLVHQIYCKTEEFGSPLYPILAATANVTVLVNLGQSSFKYRPANLQRTPNPCFLRPLTDAPSAPGLGYDEDSRELFSMGRIDSLWSASRKNGYDETMTVESEDLFEIVLDDRGPPR
ncbi:protein EAR1-like [Aristolochia californica]|uniref:protein EAR1-like n=1 Tax=Aristolochia californica TaxID=171875 RepID=UPI0035DA7C67